MAYSIEVLNNIRANASTEYQTRIPEATQTNIATIGQAFQQYNLLYNEFCDALFNQIGRVQIEQKMFKNKLARFKGGAITTGQDVEEIFVEMAKAEGSYNPAGPNPLGRREGPDVKTIYHRLNRQDVYAISVGRIDFVRVFQSPATLDAFISARINAVYSGDAYDEWLAMKNVLATFKDKGGTGLGYFDYSVTDMATATNKEAFAKEFVKAVRKASQDMSFASTEYNAAGVKTWTPTENQILLVNKDVLVEVDVERLASAFHTSETDLKSAVGQIVVMDDFGSLENTYGLLVDKDFFRVFDTLSTTATQENAQGLFTNYFYHHHQILSASTFKNAVRFKIGD